MSIPDFQSLMLPLLKILEDEQDYFIRDIIETLAWEYNLTSSEKSKLLPSGQQPIFDNRVGWAKTYLKKAGLVESPKRGYVKITKRGLGVIKQNLDFIDREFLMQYPEFMKFQKISKTLKDDFDTNEWDEIEWNEPEEYDFSVKSSNKTEILKLVNARNDALQTLIVEAENDLIIINYYYNNQKLETIWNRSTALAIANAIQQYYSY
ncbi:winged helix-turn-helix domain-containing protein [Chroococcidiopsis sp. CCNUC1]|uniref:winged helix-turn-helix domain-containing protein n=1 Tax=Chroococcidiopsis sp. CCNUC1 TaxID=2653189 RepID=UPI00201FEDD0|nr:winged helix-turn-helix domain-containing protein [Chroococcidiopsis sp. CCNUC1]URD50460.1 winged helix-turn-helix domain-containing protein [Chroococcidiopsis sp. CCNUC1]